MNACIVILRGVCLLMLALWASAAGAQAPDPGPHLRVDARMAAAADLMVGATRTFQVDVLTSTWFTQPPVLPSVNIPGALVSGPSGEATLIRTTLDGVAYSGLRYAYQVSPTSTGAMQVPAIEVQAQVGQAAAPHTARTRPLGLRASGPPDATAGHVLAAGAVQATQQIEYSAQPPAVGDHVRRVITVQAQGAQAMLIPPPDVAAVPGLKSYAAEPVLTTLTDSRGGFLGGQRVDGYDYVIGRAGAYELPAVEIRWWNVASGQEERLVLPAQRFEAAGGAAYQSPFSVEQDLRDMGRKLHVRIPGGWLALTAVLSAMAFALWLAGPALRRTGVRLRAARAARRRRWRESEPYAAGSGKRFAGLVHHTDAKREWAYDRESRIGRLDKALDEAAGREWVVVDMAKEWKKGFAFEAQ